MGIKLKTVRVAFSGIALILLALSLIGKIDFNLALRFTMLGLILFYLVDIIIKRKNKETLTTSDILLPAILSVGVMVI